MYLEIAGAVAALAFVAAAIYFIWKFFNPPPEPAPEPQPSTPQQQQGGGGGSGDPNQQASQNQPAGPDPSQQSSGAQPASDADSDDSNKDESDSGEDEEGESGQGAGSGQGEEKPSPTPAEIQLTEQKAKKILQIMAADPNVADIFAKANGVPSAYALQNDSAKVTDLAKQISADQLELFKLAAMQDLLHFNVSAQTRYKKVNYPTDRVEIEQMLDYEEISSVLPEQMVLPRDEFNRQWASQELMVMNFYEKDVKAKLLYILLDISGSMAVLLKSGFARHIWARGVIVNLLVSAQRDGGKFFFREFGGAPGYLQIVETTSQMKDLAETLLHSGKASGGTDIKYALSTAVADIRTKGGDLANADLLIITDGDDDIDPIWLKNELGDDIKLHFVALGETELTGRASLQGVAKTFAEFT